MVGGGGRETHPLRPTLPRARRSASKRRRASSGDDHTALGEEPLHDDGIAGHAGVELARQLPIAIR